MDSTSIVQDAAQGITLVHGAITAVVALVAYIVGHVRLFRKKR